MDTFSYKQLIAVPKGFSNSMMWNFSHAVIVHQLLIYGLSGNENHLEKDTIQLFKKGSTGDEVLSEEDFNSFKIKSLSVLEDLSRDYERICKTPFSPYMTGLNVELTNVDEAIEFNNMHETLHLGVMLSISKFV